MQAIFRLDQITGRFLRVVAISCLIVLMFILGANVISRVTGWFSMGWYDEIIELCFAWMVFFGAAELWRENQHFRIDWLYYTLPWAKRRIHTAVISAINIFFLGFLFVEGWNLTERSSALTPIIGFPVAILYVCIPISAGIMLLYAIIDLFRHSPRHAAETETIDDI
ncbi:MULTISPECIES: TRAP transporter small permease [Thalassospira]|uniref:TRAP transporter small permease protein n=2 Tax=Thalassospira TaxID=168934 RepID=A0A367WAP1_9PROT|nr:MULTISPECIES: TRAP transporter small permease [Thalassospira]MDG4720407.1 TRAP transporter small permease [Thalassospira sp. FZY0004]RCK37612.1 hypothetical protein TH19_10200 [Thalassospira profundimaris]